ncbi:MAG: cold shock domain-containing protein [Pseudomonas farsensis]|uniref:cold shock domain-containing protein n=1 Tax=Pseudomonas farsensis TaxID=2745492 RepID=UPI003C7D4DCE
MTSGKVKWFNNAKGFGFVNEHDSDADVFAHFSAINMGTDGAYKTLKAGQLVVFEVVQGPKGLLAKNIIDAEMAKTLSGTKPLAEAAPLERETVQT